MRQRSLVGVAALWLAVGLWGCAQRRNETLSLKKAGEEVTTEPALPSAVQLAPALPSAAPLAHKDCQGAQRYRDNICELAKKICGFGIDPGGNASAGGTTSGDYCEDAQQRCDEASRRWDSDCK
jgi:hypothetical protein